MNNLEIKKVRKELGLTQEKFANKLKISKSLVQKWESGERSPDKFAIEMIQKLHENSHKTTQDESELIYETTQDRLIAIAEEKIKEKEAKLKSHDPDLTENAIATIKIIIEGLYTEIAILQEAKNDYLKHNR